MGANMSAKPKIKYQQYKSLDKFSEFGCNSKSLFKTSRFSVARVLAFNFLGMNHISSVTDEAWIHSVNSVQTWFILIVTLGLAVAPLQNGSPRKKIKAEALIWNLFVNSGLWDEDMLSACKCHPAEAWTSPKLTSSHLGYAVPSWTPWLWGNSR